MIFCIGERNIEAKYYRLSINCATLSSMTDREIRENFHNSRILDKAHSLAYEKAGGVEAFVKSGVQNIVEATMEEAYLLGWRDAEANAKAADTTGDTVEALFLQGVDRDRPMKHLKTGEIDWEAIENAKDIDRLDVSVLGLSRRVYIRLQERGIMTIGELSRAIDMGLDRVRGIGQAASKEIIAQVRKANIDV